MFEFASILEVPRNYVDFIERQYVRIKSNVRSSCDKIVAGYEVHTIVTYMFSLVP